MAPIIGARRVISTNVIVRKLRKGVLGLLFSTHLPSYVMESKGFTK